LMVIGSYLRFFSILKIVAFLRSFILKGR
jgi:hypothetical protein